MYTENDRTLLKQMEKSCIHGLEDLILLSGDATQSDLRTQCSSYQSPQFSSVQLLSRV